MEGWAETSTLTALEMAGRYEDAGVAAIVHTDIDRDGILKGLNLAATAELARATVGARDRLGRPRRHRGCEGPAAAGACHAGRRHRRPRALRRPPRCGRGAGAAFGTCAMSYPDYRDGSGFRERSQQPFEDIPTDTEEFLRWGTTLDPDHPYKYELSNAKGQPHDDPSIYGRIGRYTANILAELFRSLTARGSEPARQSSASAPASASAIRTLSWTVPAPAATASRARRRSSLRRCFHLDGGPRFHGQAAGVQGDRLRPDLPRLQPGRAACLGLAAWP